MRVCVCACVCVCVRVCVCDISICELYANDIPALHLPTESFKDPLRVGASAGLRTQYLPGN